jgi:hypothetical protein
MKKSISLKSVSILALALLATAILSMSLSSCESGTSKIDAGTYTSDVIKQIGIYDKSAEGQFSSDPEPTEISKIPLNDEFIVKIDFGSFALYEGVSMPFKITNEKTGEQILDSTLIVDPTDKNSYRSLIVNSLDPKYPAGNYKLEFFDFDQTDQVIATKKFSIA